MIASVNPIISKKIPVQVLTETVILGTGKVNEVKIVRRYYTVEGEFIGELPFSSLASSQKERNVPQQLND